MAYATVAEFKAGMSQDDLLRLTDFEGDTDTVNDSRIQAALDDASAVIDSYIAKPLGGRVLNPVPRILNVVCRDLALYRLYINIGHGTGNESVTGLRDDALRYLKSVAAGDVALGDGTGVPAEATSPGVAMTDGPDRLLTRDSLRGY